MTTSEPTTIEMLRCAACRRLLAEQVTAPFRLRCRCGAVHEALAAAVALEVDLASVKEQYRVKLDLARSDTYRIAFDLLAPPSS